MTRLITHDGQTLSMKQWAADLGIAPATLSKRIERAWGSDALELRRCRPYGRRNDGMSLRQQALSLGLTPTAYHNRIVRGWKGDDLKLPCGTRRKITP